MATVLLANDVNKNIKTVVPPICECFGFRKSTPKTWSLLKTARAGPHGGGGISYDADNRRMENAEEHHCDQRSTNVAYNGDAIVPARGVWTKKKKENK